MVTTEDMFTKLDERRAARSLAFKVIMDRMYALQVQVPLTQMLEDTIVIPRPERQVPNEVNEALGLWDITVPLEWLVAVPAYVPVVDQGTMGDEALFKAPRPAWIPPPAGAAAAAPLKMPDFDE